MMRLNRLTLSLLLLLPVMAGIARSADYIGLLEKGNDAYESKEYKEALDYYHQAEIERPETPEIYYNQGNALTQTQSYEEAVEKLQRATNAEDTELRADAYYNLGNTHFKRQDYQSAIESYTKSLELRPDDMDAKYNLELARIRLKEQMQQQPQDQNQQQQQQKQKQKQKPGENQQKQEEPQQQQPQESENQQKPEEQQQQQAGRQKAKKKEMSKEDAERILNALSEMEEDMQQNRQKVKVQSTYRGKDW